MRRDTELLSVLVFKPCRSGGEGSKGGEIVIRMEFNFRTYILPFFISLTFENFSVINYLYFFLN